MPAPLRRLTRVLLNALAAGSLLLCVGVCVLWARSYRVAEGVDFRGRRDDAGLMSSRGHVWTYYQRGAFVIWDDTRTSYSTFDPQDMRRYDPWPPGAGADHWRRTAMGVTVRRTRSDALRCTEVISPYWMIAAPLLLPPLAWSLPRLARRRRRQRRARRGLCRDCGYVLTDNVSGVCPECGRNITPTPKGVMS